LLDVVINYANLIAKERDIHSLIETIAKFGRDISNAQRCSIWLADKKKKELWTIVAQDVDKKELRMPLYSGIVGHSIKTNTPIIENDVYNNPLFYKELDEDTGFKTECVMTIPIHDISDNQIGAIQVMNKSDGSSGFTNEDLEHLKIAASYIGDSLETLHLRQELKKANKNLQLQIDNKTKELKELNKQLEKKIDDEIQKSKEKDKLLLNQAKQAQIGEMLTVIAHQWKQPLSTMYAKCSSSLIELEMLGFDKTKAKDDYKFIAEKVDFLKDTVDEFRHFFNPKKSKDKFFIQDIVDKVNSIVQKDFLSKNTEIITKIDHIELSNYQNDIMHVILNIFNNAKDAINDKNIIDGKIFLETIKCDDILKIEISDNGGGIPDSIIDKIFEPYFTTKDEKYGTGIGLHLSKMIIESKCNGKLYVDNIPNGAKFTIELSSNF
jgi:signal transduction histidine kinase